MLQTINSYIAVLIITVIGAGASLIIIHVAYNNSYTVVYSSSLYKN